MTESTEENVEIETRQRYIAALGIDANDQPGYGVAVVLETVVPEGEESTRLGQAMLTGMMDRPQAEHLVMQLCNALGLAVPERDGKPVGHD